VGIGIEYKGNLDDPSRLDELLNDVRAYCKAVGWRCEDWEESYSGVVLCSQEEADEHEAADEEDDDEEEVDDDPEPWPDMGEMEEGSIRIRGRVSKLNPPPLIDETHRGVYVVPPDTDGLRLVFSPKGRLTRFMEMPRKWVIDAIPDAGHYVAFTNEVMTTGSAEGHKAICKLLRRLRDTYISNLEVDDQTGFWDKGNTASLREEHLIAGAFNRMFQDPDALRLIMGASGKPLAKDAKIEPVSLPKVPEPRKRRKSNKPVS
jgi:hypothetical protein